MSDINYLSDTTVFQAKYFRVRKIDIERNGKQFTKDFIERAPVVFILPYTKDGEVYIEYQYRDVFRKWIYEMISGTMEEGDDPLEAAKRELSEETGLTAKKWQKIAMWDLSVNMFAKIHVYAVTDLQEGEPHLDEDEAIKTIKMPLEKALEKIDSGEISAASHIAVLLLFAKLRKEGKL